jgi:hypothetical protein
MRCEDSAHRFEAMAVATGHSVDVLIQSLGNLSEGQFAPDPQDEHFTLLLREATQGEFHHLGVLFLLQGGVEKGSSVVSKLIVIKSFPAGAPGIASDQVESGCADGSVEQGIVLRAGIRLLVPEADESRLDRILRIGGGCKPLPCKE